MARAIVKGIKDGGSGGSMNCITITTNDKPHRDLTVTLPYSAQVANLHVGDLVRYESITPSGATETILYLERESTGVIASLAGDNMSGVITENVSGKPINFLEPNQDLIGLTVGATVKYTLVSASYASGGTTTVTGTPTSSPSATGTVSGPPVSGPPAGGVASDDLAITVRIA